MVSAQGQMSVILLKSVGMHVFVILDDLAHNNKQEKPGNTVS